MNESLWVENLSIVYRDRNTKHSARKKRVMGYIMPVLADVLPHRVFNAWLIGKCELKIVGFGEVRPDTPVELCDVARACGNRWKIKSCYR